MAGQDKIPIEMLKRLEPFSTISDSHLPDLRSKGQMLTHDKGKILFKRGESGEDLVYLLQGSVDLADADFTITAVRSGTPEALRPLDAHDPRAVTAVTTNPVRVFSIARDVIEEVQGWDEAGNYIVADLDAEEEGDWMSALLSAAMFAAVPPANIQQLFARFEETKFKAEDVVINQGDPGDYFYVIKSGRCRITRRLAQGGEIKQIPLAEIGPGDMFGEDALIGDAPRNATVSMIGDGVLMRLGQEDFEDLLQNPVIEYIEYAELMEYMKDQHSKIELLDVRLPLEYKQEHIPGSRNLPLHAMRQNLSKLSQDSIYVVTCDGGRRAILASYILSQEGHDARVLKDPPNASSSAA